MDVRIRKNYEKPFVQPPVLSNPQKEIEPVIEPVVEPVVEPSPGIAIVESAFDSIFNPELDTKKKTKRNK
jgi:hypothetical protein